ncbi:XtrA/YqaO family protein [Anaerobacillus sp. MEB173]|uniref:XtrA/YqaO family protein n=1 Tax=Anaerobacillus sp. MEB173 TaxID=3383345 RepID=UPI003F93DD5F
MTKEIKVDPKTMKAEIDVMKENTLYIVKQGKVISFELPAFGSSEVISFGGKVDRIETKTSTKI